jgi:hypothetical protein
METYDKILIVWTILNAALFVFGLVGWIALHLDAWMSGMDADDWFGLCMITGGMSFGAEFVFLGALTWPIY